MTEQLRPIKACHVCGTSYTVDDWQGLTSARLIWPIDTRVCRCGVELKLDLNALTTINSALPVDREKFRAMAEAIRAKNTPPEPEECGATFDRGSNRYHCTLPLDHKGPHETEAACWAGNRATNAKQPPPEQPPPEQPPPEPAPEPAPEPKRERMDAPRTKEAAIIRAVLDCLDAIGQILDEQRDAKP